MYLCACVRACACLIAFLVRVIKRTFERDGNFTERERERERERGLAGKIFFVFFISFLSCLVLSLSCLCLRKPPSQRRRQGEKDGIIPHQKKEGCAGPFLPYKTKEKQSPPRRKKRQSVRAEPSQRPRPSGTAATRIELSSQPSSSRFLRSIRVRASASVSLCAVCACENLYQSTPKQIL